MKWQIIKLSHTTNFCSQFVASFSTSAGFLYFHFASFSLVVFVFTFFFKCSQSESTFLFLFFYLTFKRRTVDSVIVVVATNKLSKCALANKNMTENWANGLIYHRHINKYNCEPNANATKKKTTQTTIIPATKQYLAPSGYKNEEKKN